MDAKSLLGETLSAPFQSAMTPLDYQKLLSLSAEVRTPLESYLTIRSALILGDSSTAGVLLGLFQKRFSNETLLSTFISLQCELYRKHQMHDVPAKLLQLNFNQFDHSFLKAEYHFVLGYAYNLNDEYRQATRHHKKAAELYMEVGLPCPASVAWFNLSVCYNHLNERILFDFAFERLRDLAFRFPSPTTRLHYERMEIYRLVDREEDERAIALLRPLFDVAAYLGRIRDRGSLICMLGYLYLRNGQFEAFWQLETETPLAEFAPEHRTVFNELCVLSHLDLLTRDFVKKAMSRWKKKELLSVHQLYLFDIILNRLWRGRDHDFLLKVAEIASQTAVKHQQALFLVDFRYHEILGLIRTGQKEKARMLLTGYHEDARHDGAETRLKKSRELEKSLAIVAGTYDKPEITKVANNEIVADPLSHVLVYREREIDLSKSPMIWKFLYRLMRQKSPVPLHVIFSELYGSPFNPIRHERRFNSLIDRARTMLGDSTAIMRRDGKLSLRPNLNIRYRTTPAGESNIFHRRETILSSMRKMGRPVTIAELESAFSCSRRTLQFDLKHLIQSRAIAHTGQARRRAYTLGSSADATPSRN